MKRDFLVIVLGGDKKKTRMHNLFVLINNNESMLKVDGNRTVSDHVREHFFRRSCETYAMAQWEHGNDKDLRARHPAAREIPPWSDLSWNLRRVALGERYMPLATCALEWRFAIRVPAASGAKGRCAVSHGLFG